MSGNKMLAMYRGTIINLITNCLPDKQAMQVFRQSSCLVTYTSQHCLQATKISVMVRSIHLKWYIIAGYIVTLCTCPWKDGEILSNDNKRTAVFAISWLESCPLIPSVTVCHSNNTCIIIMARLLVSRLTCLIVGEVTSITMAACIIPERATT